MNDNIKQFHGYGFTNDTLVVEVGNLISARTYLTHDKDQQYKLFKTWQTLEIAHATNVLGDKTLQKWKEIIAEPPKVWWKRK